MFWGTKNEPSRELSLPWWRRGYWLIALLALVVGFAAARLEARRHPSYFTRARTFALATGEAGALLCAGYGIALFTRRRPIRRERDAVPGDYFFAAPPTLDFPSVDTGTLDPRWSEGSRGRRATFSYCDADGVMTERVVANWISSGPYIEATCLTRHAHRSFRKDRIEAWAVR